MSPPVTSPIASSNFGARSKNGGIPLASALTMRERGWRG
jgi:hypothetical protein